MANQSNRGSLGESLRSVVKRVCEGRAGATLSIAGVPLLPACGGGVDLL